MTEPATRAAYDAVAVLYADMFRDVLDDLPLERALLTAFADLVRDAGPVADVGCGPGHVTAFLHSLGLDASGIDLSPAMIAQARADHPHLNFTEGTMKALPFPDGTLAGALAWYSMIHLAPMELPDVFAEFDRVLAPGGHLLVAFQSTDGNVPEPFDHKVVRAHRWPIGRVAELAHRAGLAEVARLLRRPNENEHSPAGHLLLRKN
ncbi:class I SAM-dependent methyltransferase [Actinomadura sp. BRA 177]|uniref:class I SAM-dependent DNA methyltransferase n=1 Tax=Actinomadura sp. BRA 177 TaxID=2745202 RepID=UPI0015960C20|nr:class I SAM-dependent methyltransferase [Actinomadura sp. BRA 177]NVI86821.1 class I SAM-dependent methyltransferase [Actinomadura sp. BRA 177]